METLSINERLKSISTKDNTWREKAIWRQDNKKWLDYAAKIAINVLSTLRNNRNEGKSPSSQKELADILNVSPQQVNKIVKGSENLTLETITHLEKALGISLIDVSVLEEEKTLNHVKESGNIILTNDGGFNSFLVTGSSTTTILLPESATIKSKTVQHSYTMTTYSAVIKELSTFQPACAEVEGEEY